MRQNYRSSFLSYVYHHFLYTYLVFLMSDTTSIDDLPLSSQTASSSYSGGGGGGGGAPLIYSPNIDTNTMAPHGPTQIPGNVMNEVMQGVQRASANGMTMIPTRDIPMNPNAFTHDDQARPNYVPQPQIMASNGEGRGDYIKEHTSMESIARANVRQSNQLDTIEAIYYDLQMPVLIGVLYFIFQMPVFRAQLLHFLPSLFGEDGNFKIMGLTATSVMFAGTFFVIMKIFNKLGEGLR
jgi:hypothetical protein